MVDIEKEKAETDEAKEEEVEVELAEEPRSFKISTPHSYSKSLF